MHGRGEWIYTASLMAVGVSTEWVEAAVSAGAIVTLDAGRVSFYWFAPYEAVSVAEFMEAWRQRAPGDARMAPPPPPQHRTAGQPHSPTGSRHGTDTAQTTAPEKFGAAQTGVTP